MCIRDRFSVVSVGIVYAVGALAFIPYIGGSMQYAALPALLCVVLAFIPSRRAQSAQPSSTGANAEA